MSKASDIQQSMTPKKINKRSKQSENSISRNTQTDQELSQ